MIKLLRVLLAIGVLLTARSASATTIFADAFEGGNLALWKPGSQGQLVVDPFNAGNHALNFTGVNSGGDIWTLNSFISTSTVWLSFDYLGQVPGTPPANSTTGDSGGFIGWDSDQVTAGIEHWIAGTQSNGAPFTELIDDNTWHRYVISVTTGGTTPIFIKIEDFVNSPTLGAGTPLNAYFDNILLTDIDPRITATAVPEPATLALLASGCGLLLRRKRKK